MECWNEEELRAWLDGGCDETTALAVETHLDRCQLCHALVAATAKLEVPADDRSASAPLLKRGGTIGRYRILEVLGTGAMGVVYAAHDETLDRKVAVKLLATGLGASAEAATRLEREAQAMARVSHPNVVAVYEIGTYEGAPFVAMEHVDGVTLAEWLREHKPKIDEIVHMFREAAIGLQEVHRAGLVHRDFKPANVLVSRDRRVRIADFGLVHLVASPAKLDGNEPVVSRVTADGSVIGTPAYLAPEQLDGRIDARGDQFSFCVALFEASFGQRPFQAATVHDLDAAARAGVLRLPKVLPPGTRWLVPILRRGLAHEPAARFPDLGALVAALSRSPARRRRSMLIGAASLASVGVLILGLTHRATPDCSTVERALTGIWDASRREAIHSAFLSRPSPGAAQAWDKASTAIDKYAADWIGRRRDACSSPGKDDATRGLVAARVACLDRRLAELRVLSELLASSDVDVTDTAPQTVAELRSPASCEREAAGVIDLSKEEQAVLEKLAEVRLLSVGWRHKEALELAREILPASEHTRPAIRAMALLRSGQLETRHSPEMGVAQLRQAVLLAETARDDEVRAESLTYLAIAMSQLTAPSDLALGEQYADQATAILARLGGDHRLVPVVVVARGLLQRAGGHYEEAVAQLEHAIEQLERNPVREPRQYSRLLSTLGIILAEMGRSKDAVPLFERALALTEGSLGPRSPALYTPVLNLGEALLRSGRVGEAAPYLERGAALAERVDGPESRSSGIALLVLGKCRAEQGDAAAARRLLEHAQAIADRLPPGDRLRFEVRVALGQYLVRHDEVARGRERLEQALREGAPGEELAAEARFALAQALPRAEHRRAVELAGQARSTYDGAGTRRAKEVAAIDAWLARK